jgi:hypothetical protein
MVSERDASGARRPNDNQKQRRQTQKRTEHGRIARSHNLCAGKLLRLVQHEACERLVAVKAAVVRANLGLRTWNAAGRANWIEIRERRNYVRVNTLRDTPSNRDASGLDLQRIVRHVRGALAHASDAREMKMSRAAPTAVPVPCLRRGRRRRPPFRAAGSVAVVEQDSPRQFCCIFDLPR